MFSLRSAESTDRSEPATPKPVPPTPHDLVAVMLRTVDKIRTRPGVHDDRTLLERSGEQLCALLDSERRPDWAWFEILFEADACRLPQALLCAGRVLGRDDFIACGIETLDWMMRGQVLANCVETMSDACEAAFAATGDLNWLLVSRTATLERRASPLES